MKKHSLSLLFLIGCLSTNAQQLFKTTLGTTFYGLQSNASTSRRIVNYTDGKRTAVWINKETSSGNRHTGYSHFNGSTWEKKSITPTSGLTNTGWPAICANSSNQELIFSHQFTGTFTTLLYKNTGPGKADFLETQPIANNRAAAIENRSAGWHKTATSGDRVYVIAYSFDNEPNTSLSNPLYFSSSTNGGGTFSNFTLLNGSDTTNYPSGITRSDSYSIDAFDKYVVIASSDLYSDLTIWKSEDFGATFTRKVVERFPIRGWDNTNFKRSDVNGDGKADTLSATNRQIDVILDKTGKAHLFWGRVFYYQDKDTGFSTVQQLFPTKANKQIVYWNELDNTIKEIAGSPDVNGNGKIDNSSLGNSAFQYQDMGFAGQVTTGIDALGNLYLAYTAFVETDTAKTGDNKGKQFHNLFVTKSTDNGKTWSIPKNITNTTATENVHPSMARLVDNSIHLIWQEDTEPGSVIAASANNIIYGTFPASLTASIGTKSALATTEMSVYPNPAAADIISINLQTEQAFSGKLELTDMMGQRIQSEKVQIGTGSTIITKNISTLASGMYFLHIQTEEGARLTQKIVVQK